MNDPGLLAGLLLFIALAIGGSMNDPGLLAGLLLFIALAIGGSFALSVTQTHRHTLPFQIQLFFAAFAIRLVMSIVIYQFGLVRVLGDADSSGWEGGIMMQSRWVLQGVGWLDLPRVLLDAFGGHHHGYFYLLGTLFFLTGTATQLLAAELNCFLGALTVVFAYRIASSLFSPWVATRAGWLVCLFPSMIIWSAQTVKEPVVIFLEILALYGCVQMKLTGLSSRHALLCALGILGLIPFRFYAAYITGAAVIVTLILPQIRRGKTSIASALAVAAFVVPLFVGSGLLARHQVDYAGFSLRWIQFFRNKVAVGGSGVETLYDLQTPRGFGMATVIGAAHLLLAPFPWQLSGGSLRMLLTLPELVVWWWLFFRGVLPGLGHAIRNRFGEIQALLFSMIGLGLLYSMMFGNIGLVYRQRAQLLPSLLIFAVVGLELRKLRQHPAPRVDSRNQGFIPPRRRWRRVLPPA